MEVRKIVPSERPGAVRLIWHVFLMYEAPDYTEEGIASFESIIADDAFIGSLEMFGAWEERNLVGVIATRNAGSHISLFFVKGEYQHRGIGRKLLNAAVSCGGPDLLTVHAAPYAVDIYRKLGFTKTGEECTEKGIRYTPMEKRIIQ